LRLLSTMATDELVWSFGFGSNMDVEALKTKKQLDVKDHTRAILKDWELFFNGRAIPKAEPSFAGIRPKKGSEVHGVAFCISKEDLVKLDQVERGYNKEWTEFVSYEGKVLKNGFVYVGKNGFEESEDKSACKPSRRYLGVLVKGATQANLKPEYIRKLKNIEVYTPTKETLAQRQKTLDISDDLPQMTVAELAEFKQSIPTRTSVLGYVFEYNGGMFTSHKGRDITTRMICHYSGLSADKTDDAGKPPYPIIGEVDAHIQEFLWNYFDCYNHISGGKCVAKLKEFTEQQQKKSSTWVLPS